MLDRNVNVGGSAVETDNGELAKDFLANAFANQTGVELWDQTDYRSGSIALAFIAVVAPMLRVAPAERARASLAPNETITLGEPLDVCAAGGRLETCTDAPRLLLARSRNSLKVRSRSRRLARIRNFSSNGSAADLARCKSFSL